MRVFVIAVRPPHSYYSLGEPSAPTVHGVWCPKLVESIFSENFCIVIINPYPLKHMFYVYPLHLHLLEDPKDDVFSLLIVTFVSTCLGRVDDLLFFDYLSQFCFLLI